MEIWKPIEGFPGYEVSNLGRVKSFRRYSDGRILSPGRMGHHYLGVVLMKDGREHSKYVHVLVAQAFLNPRPLNYEVGHMDGDGENNRADNLEWITHVQNMTMHTETKLGVKLSLEKAAEIRKLFATGDFSKSELSRQFNVSEGLIRAVIKNRIWSQNA